MPEILVYLNKVKHHCAKIVRTIHTLFLKFRDCDSDISRKLGDACLVLCKIQHKDTERSKIRLLLKVDRAVLYQW